MQSFSRALLLCLTIVFFASCDKDFNEIGADIVGDDHYGFNKDSLSTVVAYDQQIGAVQTNKVTGSTLNLPINLLGSYNNPVFGKTTASFVTQLELASINPTIGVNPVVKKVELTIPYFSTLTDTDDDGNHTYELDSIHGDAKIKLSIYASNYYLRDLDPESGFQQPQKYFSNQTPDFDANIDPLHTARLNDSSATSQNEEFFFDPAEIITYKTVDGSQQVDTRTAPGMKISLNDAFFQEKLFGAGATGNLANNSVFKEYFRGLYFKVENAGISPDQGSLAQLNFKSGKITVSYQVATSESDATPIEKTLVLNLAGNTVNLFENQPSSAFTDAVATSNTVQGDERLYLKGGAGSVAVIELFGPDADGNGIADELEELRTKGWLVNEANLTFYIDNAAMAGTSEPNRIYLYDLNNNRPLIDYYADVTTLGSNPKFNKYIHGGIIERDADDHGVRYKIRLTNHIRNLLNADIDSTNVRLGLAVTETIGNVTTAKLKTPVSFIDRIPAASAGNPLGTILYGSNPAVPEDKRLKLVIYYTKPNQN